MAKGAEKCSTCMLSRHVVHLGILKWTRMREFSPSILKLDKSLSHLRNLRANLNITKCLKNKISKTKETAEWNCSICNTDVHLYASIVCDGRLERNDRLICVGLNWSDTKIHVLAMQTVLYVVYLFLVFSLMVECSQTHTLRQSGIWG
jgi:hypothetical protein